MEKISEEEIKKNWPSAVEGSIEHPELGEVIYWTGEQHGKIVVRFSFDSQTEGESEKMFFINYRKNYYLSEVGFKRIIIFFKFNFKILVFMNYHLINYINLKK